MKRILNIAAAVVLLFGVSATAMAQSVEDNYPYNFFTLQGGVQMTLTHYSLGNLITPQVAVSAGRYFNSKLGARLHVQGWEINGGFQQSRFPFLTADTKYKFKAITGDIDLLMNMTNIINPNRASDKFDWVLIAGFGVNYGWDFDKFKSITQLSNANNYYTAPMTCGTKHATYNGRLGTQFNYNLSHAIALGLELDANFKNDEFNLKRNYDPDWQLQALIGLTFKFGPKKAKTMEVEETYYVDEPYTDVVKKKRPIEAVEVSKMENVVYYEICVSDPEKGAGIDTAIKEAAELIKTDPNAKITIVGYADKETGNPKINERLSKERAEGVAQKLVNEHGISAANIKVSWKGDTEQPFAQNEKNRCAIIKGEGAFKVTKYEEYEEKVEKTRQVAKTRMVTIEKK